MNASENQIVVYQPNETVRLDVRMKCCQCENVALLLVSLAFASAMWYHTNVMEQMTDG